MKFRCEREDILGAVQFAARAISNRATLPVLSGLRIEASDDGVVKVAATDLELTMETTLRAAVGEPGRAIVPGRLFGEMTRSLASGQVSVAGNESEVEIGSGRGQFRVKALTPDDYPALPIESKEETDAGVRVEVDGRMLGVALSQVVKAASPDESRQILTGVLWELSPDGLTLAATDSYRLAVRTVETPAGGEERRVVVPARALQELTRTLHGDGEVVTAVFKDHLVAFEVTAGEAAQRWVIGSRFIEGEFPKYRQLLPNGYQNRITMDREELIDVTRRVGLLAQNNLPVKLRLAEELEISAHTPDVGEGHEVIDAGFEGEPLVIAFNPQFLLDGASAVEGETLAMEVSDGLKPAILRGDDDSFTYLLMPVRLS